MIPVTRPTVGKRRPGRFAHQTETSSAVDEAQARIRDGMSEGLGSGNIARVRARAGAAIDADILNIAHGAVLNSW